MIDGRTLVWSLLKPVLWRLFVLAVSVVAFVAVAVVASK